MSFFLYQSGQESSSQDGRVGKLSSPLPIITSILQLNYRATIVENQLKISWRIPIRKDVRRSHVETDRKGGDTEWAGPTATV